jgi:hypothetical protein
MDRRLISAARRALAVPGFATAGTDTVAGYGSVQAGLFAVLRLIFAIRFHCR